MWSRIVPRAATGSSPPWTACGPEPLAGQFYMLSAVDGWGQRDGRPYLPRAFSVAEARPADGGLRLDFLVEAVGPGTERLAELGAGEGLWVTGPLGRAFTDPRRLGANVSGAILVGGGIGLAPLAIWRRQLAERGVAVRTLLGFRDRAHSGGVEELFSCCEVRLASEDGHAGHRGYVTDLLAVLLDGDSAASAAVYACGPPAMLEAVRMMCADRGVAAELAMEAPMACGFGACFGCAVPLAAGGYMRLCVDGPVVDATQVETALVAGIGASAVKIEIAGLQLEHPVLNGSGTFDAIAARRAFGERLLDDFPFSAFVSKTITLEPRPGNPPPRIQETPSGMINSIGLPNKGLDGFLELDLPRLAELPVPLIVSVMGTSHGEFLRLVTGVAARPEVAGRGAQRLLPERRVRTDRGTAAGRDPGPAGGGAPPDRQAADRQADAERRRPGRGRPGGGERRR